MSNEEVIELQVRAYNNRDIKAFADCHDQHVRLYTFGDSAPFCEGRDQVFNRYKSIFEDSPNLHTEVLQRIVMGSMIIDHEKITGRKGVDKMEMVAIYEVKDDMIISATFKQR